MSTPQSFIRNGMYYDVCDSVCYYTPLTEFFVDGIRYAVHEANVHVQPIVSSRDDHLDTCRCQQGSFSMWFSNPPTDAELDRYVRNGMPL